MLPPPTELQTLLKLQIQSNIPAGPVKQSQNNPLRPKGGTFCRQNVSFIAENWGGTVKGWRTRWWHTNGILVCGWNAAFASICQHQVWKLETLYRFLSLPAPVQERLDHYSQLASEIDPWRCLLIRPQRLTGIRDLERRGQKLMSLANNLIRQSHTYWVIAHQQQFPVDVWIRDTILQETLFSASCLN